MSRRTLAAVAALATAMLVLTPTASAQERPDVPTGAPDHILDLALDAPLSMDTGALDPALVGAEGEQRVIVRLTGDSVAEAPVTTTSAKKAHKKKVEKDQAEFLDRAARLAPGSDVLATTQTVLNAVFLEVDADDLAALASDPAVARINKVVDYEMDLATTVPYIGAAAVQAGGIDGSGVQVAVLDSGVDYYHGSLGGSPMDCCPNDGIEDSYAIADPTSLADGGFPNAKVVDGWDFVGSAWSSSTAGPPEAPDPDPLDDGPNAGHGTHVADIIAGIGPAPGVAPGADIVAVKVCSSVSNFCSGIALIQGMNFAVDPDGDGDTSDAVDIINMSLGSSYGQPFDDDLSQAVENASAIGVLTVASAGNSADKPFITGSPAAANSALSVAQTQVPTASLQLFDVTAPAVSAGQYPAEFQPWSTPLAARIPPAGDVTVQYGDGSGGNLNGCAPFPPGTATGKIVLVDRGACFFSTKIQNIDADGGLAGIIGLVAPGAPFAGGFGGGPIPSIPGYMISQADANAIKAGLPGTLGFLDPANQLPLVGQMVGSSSRGPQAQNFRIKPEIGAPGASVSAIASTGTANGPFGGTSGAAPMVSGSAALLLQSEPGLSPAEAKARLVNTGDTNIDIDPFSGPAEITRIGGGEVRANAAVNTPLAAWDDDTLSPTVSFGFPAVEKKKEKYERTIRVRNYSSSDMTLTITPSFRYPADAASGAVTVKVKGQNPLKVKAGKDKKFKVEITVNGELLPGNFMNSGTQGANGGALTANEFDGYVTLDDGSGTSIHLPWQVLPRQSADTKASPKDLKFKKDGTAKTKLHNKGVGTAQVDVYSLLGTSPDIPEGTAGAQSPTPDLRAFGVQTFFVGPGFCSAPGDPDDPQYLLAFAMNTWEPQTHANVPNSFEVDLDTTGDGVRDFTVLNRDLTFSGLGDGRNVAWVIDWTELTVGAFFFTEHAVNTGNTVMVICGTQLIGNSPIDGSVVLPAPPLFAPITATASANDVYFGGPGDAMAPVAFAPLGERYVPFDPGTLTLFPNLDLSHEEKKDMHVVDFGPVVPGQSEIGLLLFTNGDRGTGARGGATPDTEALILMAK